jgi:FtsP/CotA-like multicopper oxidase with cupredoxin domain
MAAKVIRRMSLAKASILIFVLVALLTALFMVRMSQGQAAPGSATDGSAVPHYFGPWPNWVLSPTTTPSAPITIGGNGTGATATATVGANGAITAIAVTNPGSGYSSAPVTIGGPGTGAAATAVITSSGAVTAVTVGASGAGYTKPTVSFSGGGAPTTVATATAYGGVQNTVSVTNAGTGYTVPTVDFDMPDDPNGTQAVAHATMDANGAITGIVVDQAGSGYASAPNIAIHDGTLMDPIVNGGSGATATCTINVLSVGVDTGGAGYTSAPTVAIADATGTGSGATATARVDNGTISAINVTAAGSGYVTGSGIRKFFDALPGLCDPASAAGCPTAAGSKYIPLGVPEQKNYNDPNGKPIKADEYQIGLVQYRTNFSSDMPLGTLVRGYVQIETPGIAAFSQHYPLTNELKNGTKVPIMINGVQALGVTPPQWLGPTLSATKNKPVRVVFRNLLPTGAEGDLFLPVDSTLMGSGEGPSMTAPAPVDNGTVLDSVRNPLCTDTPQNTNCFKQNRATLHLHGGTTPWISDGTPHQWITPANETTQWPQGVSVQDVPDMTPANVPNDGVQTFYYTNQQSARLLFYHDHAWGITRLNVYAGEAAGYLISDNTEKQLITNGTIPGPADTVPLIVQDRTFVPQDAQMYDQGTGANKTYGQDPTWNKAKWGGFGSLWYHHVYMPAQNPGDPSGMSAYGRWMYGPWFWPPASGTVYGPIDNPYYLKDANGNPICKLDDPTTWQYQTDPFCEPAKIPGTPNISAGMEQFNDTPIVNGIAYPTVTLQPKTYRFRMLNAANDRFFNFQWYVADPSTASTALNKAGQAIGGTEVALDPTLLAQAQTDPVVFPTPVHNATTNGPDWIQIGSEGGFLPAPTVVDGQQETTWITDPTRFDVGNVDKHSMLLAPAERADVIVDFSQYAGKTLILYNDAPAAFPARVPSYDYYTGAPDLSPVGAAGILPGYGPNTRTIMQVKIDAAAPAPAYNLTALRNAFSHKANGSGVFESGQHPIIVGQAAYNSAYGTSFSTGSNCNPVPNDLNPTFQVCDGFVRVNDTTSFGFNTLKKPTTKTIMPLQPKAIHDEMNSSTFDEFGRMQANLGVEAQPPTPGLQNVTLYPYVNPTTEIIDGTNLPKQAVTYDANGNPVSDIKITPISDPNDGTQIWRITHNGVDTHPIHFHLYDVQMLNRVTWDNIIIPTEPSELGWKDTIRVSPLEDTIVALRPIVPQVPWEVPNAIRNLNPMMPTGATNLFNNIDPAGNPTAPITNQLVNYGWEYVWHCHILSHEEMDMMRPQTLALPPIAPSGLALSIVNGHVQATFNDNSITETSFDVQRSTDSGTTWATAGTIQSPLNQPNTHGVRTFTDPANYSQSLFYLYRVVAKNTVGYGAEFPQMSVQSMSGTAGTPLPAPSNLVAVLQSGPRISLTWTYGSTAQTGFTLQWSVNGGAWGTRATLAANATSWVETVSPGTTYAYRIRAFNATSTSAWTTSSTIVVPSKPAAPTNLTSTITRTAAGPDSVVLRWTDNATNETGFTITRATDTAFTANVVTYSVGANVVTLTNSTTHGSTYYFRVVAVNLSGSSAPSNALGVTTIPATPTNFRRTGQTASSISVAWTDASTNETGYQLQRQTVGTTTWVDVVTTAANATSYTDTGLAGKTSYYYRIRGINGVGTSPWAPTIGGTTL